MKSKFAARYIRTAQHINDVQQLYMILNRNRSALKACQSRDLSEFILQKIAEELCLDKSCISRYIEEETCRLRLENKQESVIEISFQENVANSDVYQEYIATRSYNNEKLAKIYIYFDRKPDKKTQERFSYPIGQQWDNKSFTLQQVFEEEVPKLKKFLEL